MKLETATYDYLQQRRIEGLTHDWRMMMDYFYQRNELPLRIAREED